MGSDIAKQIFDLWSTVDYIDLVQHEVLVVDVYEGDALAQFSLLAKPLERHWIAGIDQQVDREVLVVGPYSLSTSQVDHNLLLVC